MSLKFLSVDYPIAKSYFIISKFCLGWMGQYPQPKSSLGRDVNSFLHVVIISLGVVTQFWYGLHYLKIDLLKGIDALCPATSCLISCIKMVLVIWYGKDISRVLSHLEALIHSAIKLDVEKTKIVQQFSVIATRLSFTVYSAGISASIIYSLRPLVTNIFRVSMGLDYLYDETTLRVMIPSVLLRLPWYPFTYALISYMAQVVVNAFSGVDGMFILFCLYSAALLKILQQDLRLTIEKYGKDRRTSFDEKEVEIQKCLGELKEIVRRHNEIIDLVKQFSSLFMWITLAHFVTSSIVIGASIIEALLYSGVRSILCISFTLSASLELFIFCYGGSAVIENSFELGMSAYCSNWYNCDKRIQKTLLMIIIRSQIPLKMDVPFFRPSLETFASILQTAGSFIAVVKTVL